MGTETFLDQPRLMLPPPLGTFVSREELIHHVGNFAISQGYVVTIKHSKRDRFVILGCDRGGVYRSRKKSGDESSVEQSRRRKTTSRLTNCPFEAAGRKNDGLWVLTIKNGTHNHEPLNDISQHPSARRFTEKEVMEIKEMTEAGLKPRQILKRLRQSNPELMSTPKHVYNVKAKLRQGNTTVRNFKSLRTQISAVRNHSEALIEPAWRQCNPPHVPNFIGGSFVDSLSHASIDVINPATQQVVSQAPITSNEEFKAAVYAAKRAFPAWRKTPVSSRLRVMFKFQELIRRDTEKVAFSITTEHGKSLKDAYDDILHGLEVVEQACGLANLLKGEFPLNVSNGIDCYYAREPLGVCAGICSFEFPAMIPLWMFTIAITCGNTFILKPSIQDPGASILLAELAMEAGLPCGVLNIVHGSSEIVDSICDHEDIKAVSFVGSNAAGAYVYEKASPNKKRIQIKTGVRNHAVVMPDANMDATLNALVAAGFGVAGQKCVALDTVIFVGSLSTWEEKLVERAKAIKVDVGTQPGAELGPMISKYPKTKEKVSKWIQSSVESGARLLLDGRETVVPGYELGNFIGPTILSDVRVNMDCYKEERFGPILLCMQAGSIEEAIDIINGNKYCSGASIFTTSTVNARKFQTRVEVAQVGINVVSDVPFASLVGCNSSYAGDINFDGNAEIQFYTRIKKVCQQWDRLQVNIGGSQMESL